MTKQLPPDFPYEKLPNPWYGMGRLQIDSYATGKQRVSAYIKDDHIHLEITDGYHTWHGMIDFPDTWNP